MKYLHFVLLLIAVLITAGCASGGQISNQTPPAQPTPTYDSAAADAVDVASEQAKHDAAFAKPTVIPPLKPLLPLGNTSNSTTQKCKDTIACITRPDSEPLSRTCADLILPLLDYEFGSNPCFKLEKDWYELKRDLRDRELERCEFGQGELNICLEVKNAINKGKDGWGSAITGTPTTATIQKYLIEGDYCGSMVQSGGQNTVCFHLSSSGSVQMWRQSNRAASSQSSYTQVNNRLLINVPNGWQWTKWSTKTGTVTTQTVECVFIDSDGSLSCEGTSYRRALPDQL